MVSENNNNSLKVGDLLVEPALNRISGTRGAANLRPQVMDLLVFLAANDGRVVSIKELLDQLWPGKVVTDGTLYNSVGELRQAIHRLDNTRPYIETIPKKGYRLAVAVGDLREPTITLPADRAAGNRSDKSRILRHKWGLALLCGLLVAAAVVTYLAWPREIRSIAVIPFEDISPGRDQHYLASGIADELRLELQRLDGLRVAGRTSSIAYAKEDSKTIGEMLNVDAIIEGSVRRDGSNIRITTQLTHAADGFTIWSNSYNRELDNIFEMQEAIATSVAGALGVRLGVGTINEFRGAGTRNVEAYEFYLRANTSDWTSSGVENQIRWLERAVELDPNYAAAWSLLGGATLATGWDVLPNQVPGIVERANALVLRGVQLNPESATAQMMLAMVRHSQYDWVGAEQSHRRAMELLQDRLTVGNYARVLMRAGRMEEAQKQFRIAESLEPLGGRPPNMAWHTYVAQGRYSAAKTIIDTFGAPPDLYEDSIDIAINEGDPELLKAAMRAMPDDYVAFTELYAAVLADFDSREQVLRILREVYQDESIQWIRKLHDIALLAAYFGDPQFALEVKGTDVRTTVYRMHSLWYPLTSDVRRLPGFKQLVRDLNLVEYWRTYGWADYCRPLGDEDFECF